MIPRPWNSDSLRLGTIWVVGRVAPTRSADGTEATVFYFTIASKVSLNLDVSI